MSQDAFVGSSIDEGTTSIQFDRRQCDLHRALGTTSTIWWRQDLSHVDGHALSTCHHPIHSRCIVAPGSSLNAQHQRRDFTPDIQGGSTAQHMRQSLRRLSGSLAGVCGGSLRHMARLVPSLFLRPMSQSSLKRWMDDSGAHRPPHEERLRPWLARAPATECPMDGDSPRGTATGVMVVKDAPDRLLMTHEAASAQGEDARQLLKK
jgi:hypothetical protein